MARNTPDFEDFWAQYPVHKDRKRAEQAWQRLTAGDRRAAIAALPSYITDCQQNGIQYKYAQGWLNGRRWEDEPMPAAQMVARADLQSKNNRIANAHTQSDGIANPAERNAAAPPSGIELW